MEHLNAKVEALRFAFEYSLSHATVVLSDDQILEMAEKFYNFLKNENRSK